MADLLSKGMNNRVQTVHTATKMTLLIAYEIDPTSHASSKLAAAARKAQSAQMVADGYGLVTETLIMRRYWVHVCKRIATLSEVGPGWWNRIDESELRQWAMVWLRAQSACRPQDLYGLLDGIELFSHTSWLDSTQVTLWFWDGKDTKSTKMNQHPRPADLQQQRTLSSAVVLNRPKHSNDHILPDGFEIVHRYKQCLRNRSAVLHHVTVTRAGEVEALKLRRFFLGLSGHYANHELKLATISSQTKKSLVEAGAIPHNSALQAEHLRHSSLSYAYFAVPDQLQTALLRSRHSRDVFLKCYDLPIADEQRIALEALDSTELDVIMLG